MTSMHGLRSQASLASKAIEVLEAEKAVLAKGLRELQRQGSSHEWRLPRWQQRLEYLSMDSKDAKGVYIDSADFELSPGLGPYALRFYPRGVAGGDGLCAVGVFATGCPSEALPLRLDLRIGELRRRATAQNEADGVLWLAHSFAPLEALQDELLLGAEVPPFAWSSLDVRVVRPK
ncbi:unnamed protein product, partial [Durusdinium trenchii]